MRLQWSVRGCFGRRNPYRSSDILPIMCSTAESVDSRRLSSPPTTQRLKRFWPRPTTGLGYASQPIVLCRITGTSRSGLDEMGTSQRCFGRSPSRSLARILYSV